MTIQGQGLLPVSSLRLSLDRAQLGWVHATIAARILASLRRREPGSKLEPRIHAHRDFGNLRDKGQQREEVVRNAEEAASFFQRASLHGTPVNMAGGQHSSNGHTLSQSGTRLLLDPSGWGVPKMLEGDHVEAPGPIRWRDLEAFLNRRGRSCPVLTDHLDTTVGGTLSVGGGIGTRSAVAGRQVDQVERMRLILPSGEGAWVSPTEQPDLFRYALGGQGTLGIIDRVVLRTVPHRPYVAQFTLHACTLQEAAWMAQQFLRMDPPESFAYLDFVGPVLATPVLKLTLGFEFKHEQGAIDARANLPHGLRPFAQRVFASRVVKDVANQNHSRSGAYLSLLTTAKHPHTFLWNDFFFPEYGSYTRFLRHLEREAMPRVGNRHLMAALGLSYATFPDRPSLPLSGLCPIPGERAFSIGLNYAVPSHDGAARHRIREMLDDVQQTACDMGGRMYRYGYENASAESLARIYGDDYGRLNELRDQVDPKGILNPDVLR